MAEIVYLHGAPKRKNSAKVGWVVAENGCHIWQGARYKGYGVAFDNGQSRLVHRIRYLLEVGDIPEGMHLDHFACDGGPLGCCNPHHVRPVTVRENNLRGNGISSLAAAQTHCVRGHLLEGDNLTVASRKNGRRICRLCVRIKTAEFRNRNREKRRVESRDYYRRKRAALAAQK